MSPRVLIVLPSQDINPLLFAHARHLDECGLHVGLMSDRDKGMDFEFACAIRDVDRAREQLGLADVVWLRTPAADWVAAANPLAVAEVFACLGYCDALFRCLGFVDGCPRKVVISGTWRHASVFGASRASPDVASFDTHTLALEYLVRTFAPAHSDERIP